MQEVWRVSKPSGRLYALTPRTCAEAFQDPTHVNFITAMTHTYFAAKIRMLRAMVSLAIRSNQGFHGGSEGCI